MRQAVKRDMAGMAAFEMTLQYALIRQDRSYYALQLLTSVFSLVFVTELFLLVTFSVLLPLMPLILPAPLVRVRDFASPEGAVVSLVILLLIRASKKRFMIESGDVVMDRLNREVLEPCLGLRFDVESGKVYSDERQTTNNSSETFYTMRYSSPNTIT